MSKSILVRDRMANVRGYPASRFDSCRTISFNAGLDGVYVNSGSMLTCSEIATHHIARLVLAMPPPALIYL